MHEGRERGIALGVGWIVVGDHVDWKQLCRRICDAQDLVRRLTHSRKAARTARSSISGFDESWRRCSNIERSSELPLMSSDHSAHVIRVS